MSRFGISNQTANTLGKCTFPEDGRFKKEIPQTGQQLQIDERFEDLKEISTADGNRRLEPKWSELLNEFLNPLNCYCVWVFKKHYLRKSASQKSSPYFRCEATFKVEEWNSKMKITINEESDRFGKSVFIGNINHKTGTFAFCQIKSEKRNLEKQTYKNNINIPPSEIFKDKISNIDAEVYVSGNRNDCDTNKFHQNIKNEVKKQKNFFNKYS